MPNAREALLEHFEPLPFEVLKVLCAKVCYLDAGVPVVIAKHLSLPWTTVAVPSFNTTCRNSMLAISCK